jgi:hypothetical protein
LEMTQPEVLREDFLKKLATRDLYEIIRSNAINPVGEPRR